MQWTGIEHIRDEYLKVNLTDTARKNEGMQSARGESFLGENKNKFARNAYTQSQHVA